MAEFASKGVAGAGLGLGIAGTTLGLLNGGLGNILGGMNANNCACSENHYVNRYELGLTQELSAKDQKIALLEADKYTDQKIVEVTTYFNNQIANINAQLTQQAVYNATNTANANCMASQINQLMSLTKLVVPNSSVCPGWGNVTITPATATTTTSPTA